MRCAGLAITALAINSVQILEVDSFLANSCCSCNSCLLLNNETTDKTVYDKEVNSSATCTHFYANNGCKTIIIYCVIFKAYKHPETLSQSTALISIVDVGKKRW